MQRDVTLFTLRPSDDVIQLVTSDRNEGMDAEQRPTPKHKRARYSDDP